MKLNASDYWFIVACSLFGFLYGFWQDNDECPLKPYQEESSLNFNRLEQQYAGFSLNPKQRADLYANCEIYRKLPEILRLRLGCLVHVFLARVDIQSVGFELTDSVRLRVAAEACIPILKRGFDDYERLMQVELLLQAPAGVEDKSKWGGDCNGQRIRLRCYPSPVSGTSVATGWVPSSRTIFHECAHLLDFASDFECQSEPNLKSPALLRSWRGMLEKEYPRLKEHSASNRSLPDVPDAERVSSWSIRPYAFKGKNRAEFFAVVTEEFFFAPKKLQNLSPRLYSLLALYYRLDPSVWDLKTERSSAYTPNRSPHTRRKAAGGLGQINKNVN
jgi:hypothetical protein